MDMFLHQQTRLDKGWTRAGSLPGRRTGRKKRSGGPDRTLG